LRADPPSNETIDVFYIKIDYMYALKNMCVRDSNPDNLPFS